MLLTELVFAVAIRSYEAILSGAGDDRTADLPSRDKLSEMTAEMATIFERIMQGNAGGRLSMMSDASENVSAAAAALLGGRRPSVEMKMATPAKSPSAKPSASASASTPRAVGMSTPRLSVASSASKPRAALMMTPKCVADIVPACEDADVVPINFGEFLKLSGVEFPGEGGMRPSSMGAATRASMADESRMNLWPPTSLAGVLSAVCIDGVELEDTKQARDQLAEITSDITRTVDQMVDWINQNNPPIFSLIRTAAPPHQTWLRSRVSTLFRLHDLQAKQTWLDWRVKLAQGTLSRLQEHETLLLADMNAVEELSARCKVMQSKQKRRLLTSCPALRQAVDEQGQVLTQFTRDAAALSERKVMLLSRNHQYESEAKAIAARISGIEGRESLLQERRERVDTLQHLFSALSTINGWSPIQAGPNAAKLRFFDAFLLALEWAGESSHARAQVHVLSTCPRRDFAQAMMVAVRADIEAALAQFQSSSGSCSRVTATRALVAELGRVLGRIHDNIKEVERLSHRHNISITGCTVSASVACVRHGSQVRLSVEMNGQYPFAYVPCEARVLNSRLTSGDVARIFDQSRGFGRLARTCRAVENALLTH